MTVEVLDRIEQYIVSRNKYVKEDIDKCGFASEIYYDGRIDSYSEVLDFISDIKSELTAEDNNE